MAFGLCKYKDAFGKPGEGVHQYRIGKGIIGQNGLGLIDILVTMIPAFIGWYFFKFPLFISLAILFLLGIIVHRMFCVRTAMDVLLFPNAKDS
jgi:uncharacterized membrane protein